MSQVAPILVVDDDPKIVSLICLYLERDGFRTLSAADGETALELALKQRLSLVVLDLMLPAKVEEEDKLAGLSMGDG